MNTSRVLGGLFFILGIAVCLVGMASNGASLAVQNLGSAVAARGSATAQDMLAPMGIVFALIGFYMYASTR